jgi:hypothetical protein
MHSEFISNQNHQPNTERKWVGGFMQIQKHYEDE